MVCVDTTDVLVVHCDNHDRRLWRRRPDNAVGPHDRGRRILHRCEARRYEGPANATSTTPREPLVNSRLHATLPASTVVGILLLAIPISVISANFHVEFARMVKLKALRAALSPANDAALPGAQRSSGSVEGATEGGAQPAAGERQPQGAPTNAVDGDGDISAEVIAPPSGNTANKSFWRRFLSPLSSASAPAPPFAPPTPPPDVSAGVDPTDEDEGGIAAAVAGSSASSAVLPADDTLGPATTAAEERVAATWSTPYLRGTLQAVRVSRRKLMSSLKLLELRNREDAVGDVRKLVADLGSPDRLREALSRAQEHHMRL